MEIIFFEKAELGYLNQLVDWEKICFPESSWNRNQVESHILSCPFALAKSHADYLGYCLYSTNPWELEIHKIAVLPQARRKGIAGSMIHALQSRYNMLTFFLEVNSENSDAIAFYEKSGFQLLDKRKGYYQDGNDALIYKWEKIQE